MSKAIQEINGRIVGLAFLGMFRDTRGSVREEVHDGDTINVDPDGNIGVRFLGLDTPEISFSLNNTGRNLPINHPAWDRFLSNPLARIPQGLLEYFSQGLKEHISTVTGPGTAQTHHTLAKLAEKELEKMISADMEVLSQNNHSFRFFMSFANEVMDNYGRFLCFINRNQPQRDIPQPRPLSYNERMLQSGFASPYFIWPNVNPFRRKLSLEEAVPKPEDISQIASDPDALGSIRQFVKQAREAGKGLFNRERPLKLQAFELRFLGRHHPPTRWVIDLSGNSDTLLDPQNYHTLANVEDRLFVPPEYVPLFVEHGWKRQFR